MALASTIVTMFYLCFELCGLCLMSFICENYLMPFILEVLNLCSIIKRKILKLLCNSRDTNLSQITPYIEPKPILKYIVIENPGTMAYSVACVQNNDIRINI